MPTFYPFRDPEIRRDGDEGAARGGGGADRVEHLHLGQAVGERRDRHRGLGRPPLHPRPQRLRQPRVRAELEVRVALPGIVGDASAAPASARSAGTSSAPAAGAVGTEHAVARHLDRAVGPGDDRDARRPAGVHDAAVCCSTPCAPLRIVTRTTNVSSAPPRAGAHRRQRGADRRELTQPRAHLVDDVRARRAEPTAAPPVASNHQSGTGAAGSATSGTYCTSEKVRGSPIAPVGDGPGHDRPIRRPPELVADEMRHPARPRPRRASRSASAASSANGFSHTTCRPAAHASIASAACVSGGVAIVTASTSSSASASASEVHTRAESRADRRGVACARRRGRRAREP